MDLPPMEVLRLLAKETAREVLAEAREADEERTAAAVQRGIDAFFTKVQIEPHHWVFLRVRYEAERETWSAGRRWIVAALLAGAVLLFGVGAKDRLLKWILEDEKPPHIERGP